MTREQVKRLARYSYSRGVEIYNQNKVRSFQVKGEAQYDRIEAVVKGSGRKSYEVTIAVERDTDTVAESYCECPAFYSYDGLCKHCVGVLLKYMENQSPQAAIHEFLRKPDIFRQKKQLPERPEMRRTTEQMKKLLQSQAIRQTLSVLQSETCGKVRLVPILTCGRGECTVEFRIGLHKMYVLKDVFQFANLMRAHEDYPYGKSLQFVHTIESFDEKSRPMAEFIVKWTEKFGRALRQNSYQSWNDTSYIPRLRSLSLDGWGVDALLDALGEEAFLANVCGGGEKEWRVVADQLHRKVEVRGQKDGMEVQLDQIFGYECERDFVYFQDQKIYRVPRDEMDAVRDFMECMRQLPDRKAFIEKRDMPAFFQRMLPALQECFDCTVSDIREEELGIVPVRFRFYLDMPQKDFVTCRAAAVYGEKEYSVFNHRKDLENRDLWKETEAGRIVDIYCNAYDEKQEMMVISKDETLLYQLLTEGVEKLQQLGEVFISDALRKIRILKAPRVSVGVSLTGDLLNLSIISRDMPREQLIEILSRYDRRRKFYRLKDGSFIHMDNDELEPLQNVQKALQLTDKQLKKDSIEVPRYRTLYLDEELRANYNISVHKDKNFKALIRNMKTVEDNDFEIPESLREVLREYQKYGYLWIRTLYHNGFGGILADDMGLGKTLQVICFLEAEFSQDAEPGKIRRSLIVCPASLVYNWKRELEKFAPQLPARMVTGSATERQEILKNTADREILITSYDLLRRDIEHYEEMEFFCQVIDEAQYIKNHGTQAAKAVKAVSAGFKLALTGTPVENRLSELWSIFDYLMPGYLYTYQRFREELEQPVVQKDDETAALRLQKLIRPFVLRRLKRDVLKDLPDKMEENLYADMEGEQQELYDAHVKRMQLMLDQKSEEEFRDSKLQILAELTKLRQICCDPALLYENYDGASAKKDLVINLVKNAVENGHKVLLFSQFTSMLERLAQVLREETIPYHMLTGATPKEKRAEMVEAFVADSVPVFCISLKAGGTGLNLTAADVVIHFDPWWNVAVQNQATDRAHRIGQENVVNVYRLIAKGTIEEKIMELQEKKLQLADKVLGGESIKAAGLTREELMELLL